MKLCYVILIMTISVMWYLKVTSPCYAYVIFILLCWYVKPLKGPRSVCYPYIHSQSLLPKGVREVSYHIHIVFNIVVLFRQIIELIIKLHDKIEDSLYEHKFSRILLNILQRSISVNTHEAGHNIESDSRIEFRAV